MVIVFVTVTLRPDVKDEILAEFEKFVQFVRTHQAGCISFNFTAELWDSNPNRFRLYEVWESTETWKALHQSPALVAFFEVINKLGEGALTFSEGQHYEATLIPE